MAERVVAVDPAALNRWIVKCLLPITVKAHIGKPQTLRSWRMDKTGIVAWINQ